MGYPGNVKQDIKAAKINRLPFPIAAVYALDRIHRVCIVEIFKMGADVALLSNYTYTLNVTHALSPIPPMIPDSRPFFERSSWKSS